MATDNKDREHGRFIHWYHETFDDIWFRSLIGPSQTTDAIQGCDEAVRDQWKRDLEHRKAYTREQHERRRQEHERDHDADNGIEISGR